MILGGYSKVKWKYNDSGNAVEIAYFGPDENPVLVASGSSIIRSDYDSRGHRILSRYFGKDGSPIANYKGCHSFKWKHDLRGNQLEEVCYDTVGKIGRTIYGWSRSTAEYDHLNRKIEDAYYDQTARLTLNNNGFARRRLRYDDRSNLVAETYFGIDGVATNLQGTAAELRYVYDKLGRRTNAYYVNATGSVVPSEVEIRKVTKGSIAARAGLVPGDRIVSYAGQRVTSAGRLVYLTRLGGRRTKSIRVRRAGRIMRLNVSRGLLGVRVNDVAKPKLASPRRTGTQN